MLYYVRMSLTIFDARFGKEVDVAPDAYVLDVALAHVQATRPDVAVADLVMHPDLAESCAGGRARVVAWCAEHGITPHLTTWAPRVEFFLANLAEAGIRADDSVHVPWLEEFVASERRRFAQ